MKILLKNKLENLYSKAKIKIKFLCVSMSLCKRENVLMTWRICKWAAADNADINVNNIRLIEEKFKRVEIICIIERKE